MTAHAWSTTSTGTTSCCGLPPLNLPANHTITSDPARVTCENTTVQEDA